MCRCFDGFSGAAHAAGPARPTGLHATLSRRPVCSVFLVIVIPTESGNGDNQGVFEQQVWRTLHTGNTTLVLGLSERISMSYNKTANALHVGNATNRETLSLRLKT